MQKRAFSGRLTLCLALGLAGAAAGRSAAGPPAGEATPQQVEPDPIGLYNAACARGRHGDAEGAAACLIQAVRAGFDDFSHLRRDPDLRPVRRHPIYRAILAARDAADRHLARRRLSLWRRRLANGDYRLDTDRHLGIDYVSALDQPHHDRMRSMVRRQAEHLTTLFESKPRHLILVAIVTPEDAQEIFSDSHVEGMYMHRQGVLVTPDAGRSLRHEFVHALHHDHMDRLGQEHPLWIQEGLAALYEHYELAEDGSIVYPPNDRHGVTKRLAATGRLLPWRSLLGMSRPHLQAEAARVYPQLRSIFRFIAEKGRLRIWYHRYVNGFDDDPTGLKTLEKTLGAPLDELERSWLRWLDRQPVVVTATRASAAEPKHANRETPSGNNSRKIRFVGRRAHGSSAP